MSKPRGHDWDCTCDRCPALQPDIGAEIAEMICRTEPGAINATKTAHQILEALYQRLAAEAVVVFKVGDDTEKFIPLSNLPEVFGIAPKSNVGDTNE